MFFIILLSKHYYFISMISVFINIVSGIITRYQNNNGVCCRQDMYFIGVIVLGLPTQFQHTYSLCYEAYLEM